MFIFEYCFHFLKKRIVLGIIFTFSLTYCITNLMKSKRYDDSNHMDTVARVNKIIWEIESNKSLPSSCRNSKQGKHLIADDKGMVCQRQKLQTNGCCSNETEVSKRYSCETCNRNHCCSIYEYCVSCCLHPSRKSMLQLVLSKASRTLKMIFSSVMDHFELCLAKCRTSSQSLHNENSYRNAKEKHCYGIEAPSVQEKPVE